MTTLLERSAPTRFAAQGARSWVTPWRLLALLAALGVLVRSVAPFQDIDLYWHIVLGREILDRHAVTGTGAGWSFTTPHSTWVTTQWLSEVVFARLHDTLGWGGIAALKVLVAVIVAAALARLLLRGHRSWAAPVVYAITLTVTSAVLQERPQLFSLILLVWLSEVAHRLLVGRPVSAPVVLAVTALWANLHGLWVMVPITLGLVAAGLAMEGRARYAVRPALLAAGGLLAGCLTPVGPRLLLTPFTFAASTKQIQEWQPTNFHNPIAIAFGTLLALVLVAWARSRTPVPTRELVYVGGLTAFSLMALRNLPPAALLLAPVVLARLEATFAHLDRVGSVAERRFLRSAAAVSVAVAALLGIARVGQQPLIPDTVPVALAQQLATQPGDHRVLDDYNASGAVVLWGGPRTTVAVDGRADRYGARFLRRYADLMTMTHDWSRTLASLDPNYALLRRDAQLTPELRRRGWTTLGSEGKYVLLRR